MAPSGNNLLVLIGIVGNISSVVGIVILNKYITEVDGFDYMVFLSFLHFLFTTLGLQTLLTVGVFTKPAAPFASVLPVAVGSLMSVAFMNLNLSHNSVGFYQVRRIFIYVTPVSNLFDVVVIKISLHSVYIIRTIPSV